MDGQRPNILWICTDQQRWDTVAALCPAVAGCQKNGRSLPGASSRAGVHV